jgi:uncharacterized protein YegL
MVLVQERGMTKHDLAMRALDDALHAAKVLVEEVTRARGAAQARDYKKARLLVSDAVSTASYLDHHYLRNAGTAVEDCK